MLRSTLDIGRDKRNQRVWGPLAPSLAVVAAGCAAGLLTSGCIAPRKGSPATPESFHASIASCPYQMAPLDSAKLVFANGSVKILTVSHDGSVETSSGVEKVAGDPVAEFKLLLTKSYPEVASIEIQEFKENRISVLGEVFHQIHTELGSGPMRVMDAIAAANGFTPLANKKTVRLVRENAGVVETYVINFNELLRGENMWQNILVKPGDVITVSRNFL